MDVLKKGTVCVKVCQGPSALIRQGWKKRSVVVTREKISVFKKSCENERKPLLVIDLCSDDQSTSLNQGVYVGSPHCLTSRSNAFAICDRQCLFKLVLHDPHTSSMLEWLKVFESLEPDSQNGQCPYPIKLVCVGDSGSGQTALIHRHLFGDFLPQSPLTDVYAVHSFEAVTKGVAVTVDIYDTNGQEEYDRIRPLAYQSADVFVVCVESTSDRFEPACRKWITQIQKVCPKARIIVTSTKRDQCHQQDHCILRRPSKNASSDTESSQRATAAFALGALGYIETSAKTSSSVPELFRLATELAVFGEASALVSSTQDENQKKGINNSQGRVDKLRTPFKDKNCSAPSSPQPKSSRYQQKAPMVQHKQPKCSSHNNTPKVVSASITTGRSNKTQKDTESPKPKRKWLFRTKKPKPNVTDHRMTTALTLSQILNHVDIVKVIFSYLQAKDLGSLAQVCRAFRDVNWPVVNLHNVPEKVYTRPAVAHYIASKQPEQLRFEIVKDLNGLQAFEPITTLQALSIDVTGQVYLKHTLPILASPSLEELHLRLPVLQDTVSSILQQASNTVAVVTVTGKNARSGGIAYDSLKHIAAALRQCTNLQQASVHMEGDADIMSCTKLGRALNTASKIDLKISELTCEGLHAFLMGLSHHASQLKSLTLHNCRWTVSSAGVLSSILESHPELQELNLPSPVPGQGSDWEESYRTIATAVSLHSRITMLGVSNQPSITSQDSMSAVCKSIEGNLYLSVLDLSGSNLTAQSLHVLGSSLHVNTSLKDLNLSRNRALEERALRPFFVSLGKNQTLRTLRLDMCNISTRALPWITEYLRQSKVQVLGLSCNNLGEEVEMITIKALGEVIKEHPCLRSLYLTENAFSGQSLAILATTAMQNSTIFLDLRGNQKLSPEIAKNLSCELVASQAATRCLFTA